MSWKHAPHQYAAIHFHGDDIDDCRWPVTHEITIPATLKSGVYALKLAADDARDNIPFFVVPPRGTRTARIALLVSTFTYTVYGNHARPEWFADEETMKWMQQPTLDRDEAEQQERADRQLGAGFVAEDQAEFAGADIHPGRQLAAVGDEAGEAVDVGTVVAAAAYGVGDQSFEQGLEGYGVAEAKEFLAKHGGFPFRKY